MRRSKEPFDREKFYNLIENEDWDHLWSFIESGYSVNITEEDLRLAFNILPKKYTFRNLYNWGSRFHPDFLREFKDRFTYRIFDCTRPHYKHSRILEEFVQYFDDEPHHCLDDEEFTNVLLYKHNLEYIKKFIRRFNYARIFNWWGQRQKFNLPEEEVQYLKDHVYETIWQKMP